MPNQNCERKVVQIGFIFSKTDFRFFRNGFVFFSNMSKTVEKRSEISPFRNRSKGLLGVSSRFSKNAAILSFVFCKNIVAKPKNHMQKNKLYYWEKFIQPIFARRKITWKLARLGEGENAKSDLRIWAFLEKNTRHFGDNFRKKCVQKCEKK